MRNKTVVITGASSGFGRGAALKFAKAGANVVLAARRDELLDELAAEINRTTGKQRAIAVETDVSQPDEVSRLADEAVNQFGDIDIWINNAGVGTIGEYEQIPMEEHEQIIRTNLLGTMYGTHEALRRFKKRGKGTIINVGSFAGVVDAPFHASYSASKYGIRGLDLSIRAELQALGKKNIHISTVMPVSHDTPFFEHAGTHSGHEVRPMGKVYDPQKTVDAIFRMARKPQAEVIVGGSGKVAGFMHKFAPRLVESQMAKKSYKTEYKEAASASPDSRSIFRPSQEGRDIYGGWTNKGAQRTGRDLDSETKSGGALRWIGILAPAAILLYALKRNQNTARGYEINRAA